MNLSPYGKHRAVRQVMAGRGCNKNHLQREEVNISLPLSTQKVNMSRSAGHDNSGILAERSVRKYEVLDVLSISSSTISRLMEGVSAKIFSEMCKIQRETVNEMKKIATGVTESVSSEMLHCEGLFSMLSRSMNGVRGPRGSTKTSLSEWETKLNALTTDTDVVFNKEIIGWLLAYNSPITAVSVLLKHDKKDVESASLSAQTLIFSIQPGDKKFNYNGKIGTLHSEFIFTVIRNAF